MQIKDTQEFLFSNQQLIKKIVELEAISLTGHGYGAMLDIIVIVFLLHVTPVSFSYILVVSIIWFGNVFILEHP